MAYMAMDRRGRPRSTEVDRTIIEATRELLLENGYTALTMGGVAARAGVGKQSVYRRWTSKARLVADAVAVSAEHTGSNTPPNTSDVEKDLRVWLNGLVTFLAIDENNALVRALAAAAADDTDNADALYRHITGPSRDRLLTRLTMGKESGQIRLDASLEGVADAITGAVLFQVLAGDLQNSATPRMDGLLDVILSGITSAD